MRRLERAAQRAAEPELAEDALFSDLDRAVRGRLRTLSKENAETVGRHLVMVGRLLDTEPERAYEHAQAAVRRAGRVDVVREAAGLAAYRTQRYAEALRELRTVRRLSGSAEHLAIMADAERGLGRPERAVALSKDPDVETLSQEAAIELAIVLSGARLDLGESEAAVAALATPLVRSATGELARRVSAARATALAAAGQSAQAAAEAALAGPEEPDDVVEDVLVFDLVEESGATPDLPEDSGATAGDRAAGQDGHGDDRPGPGTGTADREPGEQ